MFIGDRLTAMRDRLLVTAEPVVEACQGLAERASNDPASGHEEDLCRAFRAAEELTWRIRDLVNVDNDAVRRTGNDLEALSSLLRHDLRNAVGAVKGYLEMVDEDVRGVGTGTPVGLGDVLDAVAVLESSVNEILDFGASSTRPAGTPTAPLPAMEDDEGGDPLVGADGARLVGKILVVDDDETNRDLMCERLTKDGHEAAWAASGKDALEVMRDGEFDIVLLDLMMPGMSGFDVMNEMLESASLRSTSIIVVSGLGQQEHVIRSIKLGALDYLPKPVDRVLLRARIEACLVRRQWQEQERLYRMHLEAERDKSHALLLNTMPESVINRLTSGEKVIADSFDSATILFSDFVGFTKFSSSRSPAEVVQFLDRMFTAFDELGLDLGVEKIKTVGDGYLAAGGLPIRRSDHADVVADMALGMLDLLHDENRRLGTDMKMRIGLHSGPVVAGVIGSYKFAYDVWGATVNIAARLESYSLSQHIHISAETAALLAPKFDLESRGVMSLRGVGEVETFFLIGRKAAFANAAAEDGVPEPGGGVSVLIADDEEGVRDFMARRIRQRGWQVDTAAHGNEAWDLIHQNQYELLITDCSMPEVDGFELARRIRHEEKFAAGRMAIIALTGTVNLETAQRCLDAGMDSILSKPVMWNELDLCVRRLLGDGVERLALDAGPKLGEEVAPADNGGADEILDLRALIEVYGAVNSAALDSLKLFQDSAEDSLRRMLEATVAHDYPRASKDAHGVIGLAQTAGAMELAAVCTELKKALDERDVVGAGISAEHAAAAFGRLRLRIQSVIVEYTNQ